MIEPIIDSLSTELAGQANIGKIEMNMDNMEIAAKYGLRSVPSLLFFKDGEVKDQIIGANVTKDGLKDKLLAL